MPKGPPNRANDARRQPGRPDAGHDAPMPLNNVRGGSVCDPHEKGGHILKGTMSAAVCMPTAGIDTRPRWRKAGEAVTRPSRHSTHAKQHR